MTIKLFCFVFAVLSCCPLGAQTLDESKTIVVIAKYVSLKDAASGACGISDRELSARFLVEKYLSGSEKKELEFAKCTHYGLNPYAHLSSSGQEKAAPIWLLVLEERAGFLHEKRSYEVFADVNGRESICPEPNDPWIGPMKLQMTDMVFGPQYAAKVNSDADRHYYQTQGCFLVVGNVAKRARGIHVADVEAALQETNKGQRE